jgi:arsenite methyltransferase
MMGAQSTLTYLDFQATVGITKHNGGFAATNELLSLCHVEGAKEVLEVGCGIGVGPVYVARNHGCRVIGVDISARMIEWSRLRAREENVEATVQFNVADVLHLPFEADRFDVVLSESVLAFVADKRQAIAECLRVTKPGGHLGLNETFWKHKPSPELVARMGSQLGTTDMPTAETWQALWEQSGLRERVVKLYDIEPGREIRDRMEWVGRRWAMRGFVRLARLYLTNPAVRQSLREMYRTPAAGMQEMGYGLFVGKKL